MENSRGSSMNRRTTRMNEHLMLVGTPTCSAEAIGYWAGGSQMGSTTRHIGSFILKSRCTTAVKLCVEHEKTKEKAGETEGEKRCTTNRGQCDEDWWRRLSPRRHPHPHKGQPCVMCWVFDLNDIIASFFLQTQCPSRCIGKNVSTDVPPFAMCPALFFPSPNVPNVMRP